MYILGCRLFVDYLTAAFSCIKDSQQAYSKLLFALVPCSCVFPKASGWSLGETGCRTRWTFGLMQQQRDHKSSNCPTQSSGGGGVQESADGEGKR